MVRDKKSLTLVTSDKWMMMAWRLN